MTEYCKMSANIFRFRSCLVTSDISIFYRRCRLQKRRLFNSTCTFKIFACSSVSADTTFALALAALAAADGAAGSLDENATADEQSEASGG